MDIFTGFRTIFFVILTALIQLALTSGWISSEEGYKLAEAAQAISIALAAIFMRLAVKRGFGEAASAAETNASQPPSRIVIDAKTLQDIIAGKQPPPAAPSTQTKSDKP